MKKAARLADHQELTAQSASECDAETEWELGKLPLHAMGLLASCIEEDLEDDSDFTSRGLAMPVNSFTEFIIGDVPCLPLSGDSDVQEDLGAEEDREEDPCIYASHIAHPVPRGKHLAEHSARERKRKLKDVEFVAIDRQGVEDQMAETQVQQLEEMLLFNPVRFAAQSRILLTDLKAILDGPCPASCEEVRQLHHSIDFGLKRLGELTSSLGAHGQVARDIVCMIKEDVLEDSAGLRRWLAQTAIELSEFDELDEGDQACFFRYFSEEMLECSVDIGFRLAQVDEIEEESR